MDPGFDHHPQRRNLKNKMLAISSVFSNPSPISDAKGWNWQFDLWYFASLRTVFINSKFIQ
jgi:hypothetical protein